MVFLLKSEKGGPGAAKQNFRGSVLDFVLNRSTLVLNSGFKCRMIGFKHSCVFLKFILHLQVYINSPSKSQWLSLIANF